MVSPILPRSSRMGRVLRDESIRWERNRKAKTNAPSTESATSPLFDGEMDKPLRKRRAVTPEIVNGQPSLGSTDSSALTTYFKFSSFTVPRPAIANFEEGENGRFRSGNRFLFKAVRPLSFQILTRRGVLWARRRHRLLGGRFNVN